MKHKHQTHRRAPAGTAPGTLIADPSAPPPRITVLAYGPDGFEEPKIAAPANLRDHLGKWPVLWVNVEGIGDAAAIETIGSVFGLHPLALEDVVNQLQRAKAEEYDRHYFIVAQMAVLGETVETEQLSLFLGRDFVVTFQPSLGGDCLDPVRKRIRQGAALIRRQGPDSLAHSILDTVIDAYFPILEDYGERLEAVEDRIVANPTPDAIGAVHAIKRDLLLLRRVAWPLREAVNSLIRDESPLLSAETRVYLRDCYDHAVRIIDFIETFREFGADITDLYMSSVGNRMNEIMKVLTVISTLFIPLTFVVGLYGMNFNTAKSPLNMPELNWYWGYPFVLALMLGIIVWMLVFFRNKGWLSRPP